MVMYDLKNEEDFYGWLFFIANSPIRKKNYGLTEIK